MPRREAHLVRWQVASIWVLFGALSLAYVFGLVRLQQQRNQIISTRNAQISALKQTARQSCRSRHLLAVVDLVAISDSRKQTRIALKGPFAQVPGARSLLEQAIREDTRLLKLSRAADCKQTLPVPPSPKPPSP